MAAPFHRFLELDEEREEREPLPGRTHRMALAYWATGQYAMASEYWGYARDTFGPAGAQDWAWEGSIFSRWRYQRIPDSEFLQDLDEIEALINGDRSQKPRFMTAVEGSPE